LNKNLKYYQELLLEYKVTFIIVFSLIVLLGVVKIIITQNLFVSNASIKIMQYSTGYTSLLDRLNPTRHLIRKPDDEAKFIESDRFINQAINDLHLTTQYFVKDPYLFKAISQSSVPYKVSIHKSAMANAIFMKLRNINSKDVEVSIYKRDLVFSIAYKFGLPLHFLTPIYHKKVEFGSVIKIPDYVIKINEKNNQKLSSKIYFVSSASAAQVLFQIKRHLVVHPIFKNSNIIKITYRADTPQRAQALISRLLFLYHRQNLAIRTKRINDTIDVIVNELKRAQNNLNISAKKVENYQTIHHLLNVKDEYINDQKTINTLRLKSATLKIDKKSYEILVQNIMEHKNLNNIAVRNKSIMTLVLQKDTAISKEKELLANFTPKYPGVIAIRHKIEFLGKRINETIINQLVSLKAKINVINNLISKLQAQMESLPKYSAHLEKLNQKYKIDSKIYQNLLKNKLQITSNIAKAQIDNLVIDYPKDDFSPIYPKRILWFIITIILAFIGAFIAVLIKNLLNQTITKPNDVIRITKYPLFGTIPFVKSKDYNKLFILDGNDVIVESFRKIRTNLEYVGNYKTDNKTILITSSVSNEGKTTFAANLAVASSMLNKKIIVLSFDLRIPQLHMKFNLKNKIGVSEILAGKATLEDVIQPYVIKKQGMIYKLDVVTSGAVPPNPAELINSSRLEDLMKKLRQKYDIIIMDAPPMMTVSETKTLIKESDVTLFVLKADKSKVDNLEYLNSFSEEFKKTSFGVILTSVKEEYLGLPEYDKNYAMYVKASK